MATGIEQFLAFFATVVLVSTSGVMSPGPLFAANIFYGLKQGAKAGLKLSYGHTVVELPLVILLGVGAISLEEFPQFRIAISILGGLGLFAFAGLQIKSIFLQKKESVFQNKHGAFFAGILFSALNPFFIVWWLTIGFKLISDSIAVWSLGGIGIMFAFHIWMDYAWLGSTSFLASKGSSFLTDKSYKILLVVLSAVLVYFGIIFLLDGLS